ncbi:hypothetical protein CPB86DRAFT_819340 [Serendipita vermifera]|nr:hypothetical protein CPB86DRAFT_819340 [Serendipita vermifera]
MATSYLYEYDWVWRVYEDPIPLKFALRSKHVYYVCPTPGSANPQVEQDGLTLPLSPITAPEEHQAELEFVQKLESTEALVMMTQILDYDLSKTVKGTSGLILRRTLGARSFVKRLCVTLGLLAFQWPFRSNTFYPLSTKQPIVRRTAILRVITEWNGQRPRTKGGAILLDPTYQHGDDKRAIYPSVAEYLKAIKPRDQEGNFKKENREVVESTDFARDQCAENLCLWHQIAKKRIRGETAVLSTLDESMLRQLFGGGKGERSPLPLRRQQAYRLLRPLPLGRHDHLLSLRPRIQKSLVYSKPLS